MTGSYWSVLPPGAPAHLVRDLALSMERAGYTGAYSPQLYAAPWARLGTAAASTTTLHLASGVAIAGTRSPVETAHSAVDLQVLTGGRFVLGLGTSVSSWMRDGFGVDADRPLARLREVIETVRAFGTPAGATSGRFWPHRPGALPATGHVSTTVPPIWVAALRSGTLALALDAADGLIGHPMWPTRLIRDEIAPAATRRRALVPGFAVNVWRYVSIDDDPRRAMDAAKNLVGFYAAIPDYEPYFDSIGFGPSAIRAIDCARRGDADFTTAISDELATEVVAVGDLDEVAVQIRELHDTCDSVCLAPPSNQGIRQAAMCQFSIDKLVRELTSC